MTKIKREKLLREMVKNNNIDEKDVSLYRFLISLFVCGANRGKIEKWIGAKVRDKWWNNLKNSGYFKNNKIVVEKGWRKYVSVELALMACVALGYIERRLEK